MLYIIFQSGWEPVLIQWIVIGFEAILEKYLKHYQIRHLEAIRFYLFYERILLGREPPPPHEGELKESGGITKKKSSSIINTVLFLDLMFHIYVWEKKHYVYVHQFSFEREM